MSRLSDLTAEDMDPAQVEVYNSIRSGPRGKSSGPFSALLYSPELTTKVEQLGVYIRYECTVPVRQRELLICVVAAHWRADYEWYVHAPLAVESGISQSQLNEIADGMQPQFVDANDNCAYNFATQLLQRGRVSDETYRKAIDIFGEKTTVEMTGLLGYYVLLAMTLNTFEVDVPESANIPWIQPENNDQ